MSLFVDQVLLQLSDPAQLIQLLAPAADATHAGLKTLVNAALTLDSATLHDVLNPRVVSTERARPIFPLKRTHGTWTGTTPSYSRTEVHYERPDVEAPVWIDLAAAIDVTLVLEVDSGAVASIITREIANFTSLDDFRSRFQYLALDAFMQQLGVSTFDELRDRYRYLLTDVQLQPLPPFNPADPANQRHFLLGVAGFIRDSIDVGGALREAKLAQATMERALTFNTTTDVAQVRTPYAPVVIFPQSALAEVPFTANALQTFFANENILALFVAP